ncbi:hypothetical protein ACS0TY_027603 [Phlomoides rotata]
MPNALETSSVTNGELCSKVLPTATIYVDKSNQSSLSTIQSAIDSVPSTNTNWICISIKAGVYNEQVNIPPDKPFIYMKGEGIGKTNVVFDANASMVSSATFASMADNILVSGVTFVNSYNYPPNKNGNPVKAAVAARISGNKSAFYNCSFLGYQDTLLDDAGRHYFMLCTIEGAIDFIFGNGQSIYENCKIQVNIGSINPGTDGFITAQGRESRSDGGGFVFKECSVGGNGKALLGRAWKGYSQVIFYDSYLSHVVDPIGWSSWTFQGHEDAITFAEAQCRGPGSKKANRVKWEKTLTEQELESFTNISYIDNEGSGWISKLPRQN